MNPEKNRSEIELRAAVDACIKFTAASVIVKGTKTRLPTLGERSACGAVSKFALHKTKKTENLKRLFFQSVNPVPVRTLGDNRAFFY